MGFKGLVVGGVLTLFVTVGGVSVMEGQQQEVPIRSTLDDPNKLDAVLLSDVFVALQGPSSEAIDMIKRMYPSLSISPLVQNADQIELSAPGFGSQRNFTSNGFADNVAVSTAGRIFLRETATTSGVNGTEASVLVDEVNVGGYPKTVLRLGSSRAPDLVRGKDGVDHLMFTIPQYDPTTGILIRTNVFFVPLGGESIVVAAVSGGGLSVEPLGGTIDKIVPLTPMWSIDADGE